MLERGGIPVNACVCDCRTKIFKKFKNSSSKGILAVSDSCNLVYPLEEERFKYPIVLPRDNDNLLQTSWEGWHHASDFDINEG